MATRLELASADFLGRPYRVNPLVGSAETPEVFVADTDGFDCVTYVETVLARASARNSREFSNRLKRLRYRSGQISWIGRNHYMTNWIRNNVRQGIIREIRLTPSIVKKRVLDAIAGLPPQKQHFRCFPKRRLPNAAGKLRSGDLLFFASIRQDLDVFHCGILIKSGNRLLLRHASRSQGAVVEQELPDFLKKNRMAGVNRGAAHSTGLRVLSSNSLREVLAAADSVAFITDPRVRIEPGPAMFDRMNR